MPVECLWYPWIPDSNDAEHIEITEELALKMINGTSDYVCVLYEKTPTPGKGFHFDFETAAKVLEGA